ncbi:LysR substrate-binding domain-containing protein [Shimazuella alba]|uniref:LysR substrate-binding domain-containing protein n=1 Tax=Shimazuella alba TaxID=2690964 RepID=UPI00308439E7
MTTPDFINSHYSWHLLGKFELFLTLPLDHKRANKKNIYLEEIGDEPYIGLKSSYGVGSMIDTMFANQQITPRTVFQADELDTVAGLVSTGLGISFLPKTISLQSFPLVWLPVTAPECEVSVSVIWKKGDFFPKYPKYFLISFRIVRIRIGIFTRLKIPSQTKVRLGIFCILIHLFFT